MNRTPGTYPLAPVEDPKVRRKIGESLPNPSVGLPVVDSPLSRLSVHIFTHTAERKGGKPLARRTLSLLLYVLRETGVTYAHCTQVSLREGRTI
jgi:hypothetical protein